MGIVLNAQGARQGRRGWPGQLFRRVASGGRLRRRDPAARAPLPLGPAVMVLQRGPLLLLTLSLGLARAQKTLDEVPVQPGFNAHKVTELGRFQAQPCDGEVGAGCCRGRFWEQDRGERPAEGRGASWAQAQPHGGTGRSSYPCPALGSGRGPESPCPI